MGAKTSRKYAVGLKQKQEVHRFFFSNVLRDKTTATRIVTQTKSIDL